MKVQTDDPNCPSEWLLEKRHNDIKRDQNDVAPEGLVFATFCK